MIVVTGGAGFIGSAIVAALNTRGITDVVIVDFLESDEKWKNLRNLHYADYIEADEFYEILNAEQIDWPIETIIHMGACSDTTETDASYLVKNNYECSKMLACFAAEKNAHFIYASSAATYGDGEKGFVDDQDNLEELLPLNMYGYSKQMFDLWVKKTGMIDNVAGLKYFNVFGPNEYHKGKMRSFVIKAFEQITKSGKVKLFKSHNPDYADGEQLRDFLYIKDCTDMTLFFMDNPDANGIFNIGTGKARSWNDLAKAVFGAMNKKPNIEYIPMPEELQGKYQYFTQADITKLQNAGYDKEQTTLEEAIKDYVKNYLQNDEYLPGM